MVDPIALKEFFAKAQRLRPNQSTLLPKHFDLTSTDTNALLAFTANEEELGLIRQNINEAQRKLEQLEATTIDEQLREEQNQVNRHSTRDVRANEDFRLFQLETHLRREYDTLASLTDQYHRYIDIFEKYQCSLKNETRHLLSNMKSAQVSSSRRRTTSTTNNDTGWSVITRDVLLLLVVLSFQLFYLSSNRSLESNDHVLPVPFDVPRAMLDTRHALQNLNGHSIGKQKIRLVGVGTCSFVRSFTFIPIHCVRQCASCVNAQQEELDQCHVNVNEPRQIRPRRTNELVLREAMIKVTTKRGTRRFIRCLSFSSDRENESQSRIRLRREQKPARRKERDLPLTRQNDGVHQLSHQPAIKAKQPTRKHLRRIKVERLSSSNC